MPELVTENVAVWPAEMLSLAGCVVMDGAAETPVPAMAIVFMCMITEGVAAPDEPDS